jgi:hypothetical protein
MLTIFFRVPSVVCFVQAATEKRGNHAEVQGVMRCGGCLGRALLRLKPSRICDNMGHYERYGGPQHSVNALAGAGVGRPFHQCNLRFPW